MQPVSQSDEKKNKRALTLKTLSREILASLASLASLALLFFRLKKENVPK